MAENTEAGKNPTVILKKAEKETKPVVDEIKHTGEQSAECKTQIQEAKPAQPPKRRVVKVRANKPKQVSKEVPSPSVEASDPQPTVNSSASAESDVNTKQLTGERKGFVERRSSSHAYRDRKASQAQSSQSSSTPSKRPANMQVRSLDITTERPNRKAGNLAGDNRSNRFGAGRGRGGSRSGFSGSQARANANAQSGTGGYNRGGTGSQTARRPYGGQRTGAFGQRSGFKPGGFQQRVGSAPMPMETNKPSQNKKSYKGKKQTYQRREDIESFEEKVLQRKKKVKTHASAVPKQIEIMETIPVFELARKMNLKATELVAKLFSMGMMVTVNESIDSDTATLLASEYQCDVKLVSLYDETIIESSDDSNAEMLTRPPVVTIMGHVDHGKTKTLDAIRKTHIAESEFGGITQHIGAYSVQTAKGRITFLDTPGHEAFTMMRARGAEITDIVVLVVAADDGVMPQTIEAINHAKDAKVPIIVAINKIDKPEANPDKVMTRLSELGLTPEEWGGDTMYVKISALKKLGLNDLLDAILLQAEVLELTANYECRAEGKVVESQIDHGRGIVATIIVQKGTLRTGDPYVAGVYSGRVRAIFNDKGSKIDEATPSMPVEILGLEGMPDAGDPFQVTETERTARQISAKRQELKRYEGSRNVKKVTLDNLYETIHEGEILELKVIIKGDVQGSVQALTQSLEKLSTKEVRLNVIHASAGAINDSDVMLAAADSNAIIVGFNVRPTPQAKLLAEQEKVDIRKYNVIYKAVEEIELAMEGLLRPDLKEQNIGLAEVRQVFKVPKVGNIAGSYILEGIARRNALVHVIREGIVIHSGKISSLRRVKDDVKEVASGFECGVGIENFNDLKVGDQLEFIEVVEVVRKLKDTK